MTEEEVTPLPVGTVVNFKGVPWRWVDGRIKAIYPLSPKSTGEHVQHYTGTITQIRPNIKSLGLCYFVEIAPDLPTAEVPHTRIIR